MGDGPFTGASDDNYMIPYVNVIIRARLAAINCS